MRFILLLLSFSLVGCGTYIPQKSYFSSDQLYTIDIHKQIQCEIIDAIQRVKQKSRELENLRGYGIDFFDNWALIYTTKIILTEDTTVDPTLVFSSLNPTSVAFTINPGLNFSAKAKTTETQKVFSTVKQLKTLKLCQGDDFGRKIPLFGNDLGLSNWLITQISVVDSGLITSISKADAFTYDVRFDISKNVSATPQWSFTNKRLSRASSLFRLNRNKAHSVVFTFGPTVDGRQELARNAIDDHNARLIGGAVDERS